MSKLKVGSAAPAFSLLDQHDHEVKLEHYKGRKLLVYFYPRANTPGCTRQSCAVRDAVPDFEKLGIAAVGISPDKPASQNKFDEKYSLGFPLLSDPDKHIAESFGVYGEKTLAGKLSLGIIRSSFLIDEDGKIMGAWYKVKPEDTVPKAQAILDETT